MDHGYAQNLQTHFLRVFVANLKIDAIYAVYLESFCDKNLAIRKVFAFSDSDDDDDDGCLRQSSKGECPRHGSSKLQA